jgi:uncharacterized delta-60 repeat protein
VSLLTVSPAWGQGGTLDPSFGGDGMVTTSFLIGDGALAMAVQADGRIVVAGFTDIDFAVARYNADGSLDPSFSSDGKVMTDFGISLDHATAIALQEDGRIVVAGRTQPYSAYDSDIALARYNADGSLDSSFGGDGLVVTDLDDNNEMAADVAVQADGRIVVAGHRGWPGPVPGEDFLLVRYNADGSLDPSFGNGGLVVTDFDGDNETAEAIALLADGRMVAAGKTIPESGSEFALARYHADGTLDASFGSGGKVVTDFGGVPGFDED